MTNQEFTSTFPLFLLEKGMEEDYWLHISTKSGKLFKAKNSEVSYHDCALAIQATKGYTIIEYGSIESIKSFPMEMEQPIVHMQERPKKKGGAKKKNKEKVVTPSNPMLNEMSF